jgi:hypothetical protein
MSSAFFQDMERLRLRSQASAKQQMNVAKALAQQAEARGPAVAAAQERDIQQLGEAEASFNQEMQIIQQMDTVTQLFNLMATG